MGCAVIWSYIELFGHNRLHKAVFVDQAPLQYRNLDWELGSKGCYDAESLAALQKAVNSDMSAFADGNAACCLSLPLPQDILQLLKQETLRCKPQALAALMADHTQLDWRPILPRINLPCLNMVGGTSGVFPVEGALFVGQAIPDCVNVIFKRANHWLYLEHPDVFNRIVLDFAHHGNVGKPKLLEYP
eukprot:jgi/Chrzof1/434/Cz01g15220.t1